MSRITKDPTERRQEILDTALKLFWEKGYEKTSMTEIAQAMQVLINMPSGKWIRSPAY